MLTAEDDEGNVEFSSWQCERKVKFNTRLKWRAGDMATLIVELQASDDIFFSKLLKHICIGLRHWLQLVCKHLYSNHSALLSKYIALMGCLYFLPFLFSVSPSWIYQST